MKTKIITIVYLAVLFLFFYGTKNNWSIIGLQILFGPFVIYANIGFSIAAALLSPNKKVLLVNSLIALVGYFIMDAIFIGKINWVSLVFAVPMLVWPAHSYLSEAQETSGSRKWFLLGTLAFLLLACLYVYKKIGLL
jgi:hypothetical protein